jgi:hypothetical protein
MEIEMKKFVVLFIENLRDAHFVKIKEGDTVDLSGFNEVSNVNALDVEDVFGDMNSFDCPWFEKSNVICIEKDRSMCVGDVVFDVDDQQAFYCAPVGFIKVNLTGEPLPRREDRRPTFNELVVKI